MAKLSSYFGPHSGNLRIYVGFFQIGSGTFKAFDDFYAAFTGSYQVFGQSSTFTLDIRLIDATTQSVSGPCEITMNNETDTTAAYNVSGKKLTFTTKLNTTPIEVYTDQGGTQVDGVSNHNLWIGP